MHQSMCISKTLLSVAGAGAGLMFAWTASAAPITADFRGSFDLPSIGSGPRVIENLGEPIAGAPDADLSHEIANPSFWVGALSIDLDASGLITLTGVEDTDRFDLVEIDITNIIFDMPEVITGIVEVTNNAVTDPGGTPFVPVLSFGDAMVSIIFDETGMGTGGDLILNFGQTSTYQLSFGPAPEIPLAAAFPLFLAGLAGLSFVRRTRRTARV